MIRKRSGPSDKSRKSASPVVEDQPIREVNGVSIAAQQLRSFIDRILNLKAEQDTIGDDVKDIYAEAKGFGFDKTAIGQVVGLLRKKAKQGAAEFDERNAIVELYLQAYEGPAEAVVEASRTHTDARAREDKPKLAVVAGKDKRADGDANIVTKQSGIAVPHDPITGEVHEPEQIARKAEEVSQPQITGDKDRPVLPVGDPDTIPEAKASEDNGTTAKDRTEVGIGATGEVSRLSAGSGPGATIPPVGAADDHSVIAGAGAAVASAAPAEIPDADIPAFLKVGHRHPAMQTPASPRAEAIALRRPFCQHLNNWAKCAGHGDVHCSSCQKIADEARQ